MPCSDIESVSDVSKTEISIDYNQNHDHSTADLCSPFCHCQCCQVPTIDTSAVVFEPMTQHISKEKFTHFDSLGEEISHSLFQPPRV